MVLCADRVIVVGALLAALADGRTFSPLDARLPPARLAAIVADLRPGVILADAAGRRQLELAGAANAAPVVAAESAQSGQWLAEEFAAAHPDCSYIYFTSGTTGRPKGICGSFRAVQHFVEWEIEEFSLDQGIRVSQLTSAGFDAFLRDVLVPLCAGGSAHLPPDGEPLTGRRLAAWLEERSIGLLHAVPTVFRTLRHAGLGPGSLAALHTVCLAGEPVLASDVAWWRGLFGDRKTLVNLYGPSETTMTKVFHRVVAADALSAVVPAGKPLPDVTVRVLVNGEQVTGAIGEVEIETPFPLGGYLIPPSGGFAGRHRYRTGDLGRVSASGDLEILGRRDQQVKVNGVRIELTEVEIVLRAHPQVHDACAAAMPDASGELVLCGYVVLDEGASVPDVALAAFCAEYLDPGCRPTLLYPAALAAADAQRQGRPTRAAQSGRDQGPPAGRGASARPGNRDRDAIRRPADCSSCEPARCLHSPRRRLAADRARSGPAARPIRGRYPHPGIHQRYHCGRASGGRRSSTTAPAKLEGRRSVSSIPLRPERGQVPLSHAQEAIWRAERTLPGTALHNEAAAFLLRGSVDPDALAEALKAVTSRFELLRCAITEDGEGRPWHRFCEAAEPMLTRVDLSALPPQEREEELSRLMRRRAAEPFDLTVPPLLRTDLVTLAAEECVLQFTAHHLIADAWALGLFLDAVSEAYTATASGDDLALARASSPARPDFGDYACWQRDDPDIGRDVEYWNAQLSGDLAAVTLPDRLATAVGQPYPADSIAGAVHHLTLPADLAGRLRDVGRANRASLAAVLLTLWCSTLRQFSGSTDMVIGIPVATRNRSGLGSVVGPLLNILAFPVRLAGSASFAHALQGVREELRAGLHRKDTPFDLVRQHTGNSAPFNVMYAFHGGPSTHLRLPGVDSISLPAHSGTAKYDLTLFARPRESGDLDLDIEYRTAFIAPSTIASCSDTLISLACAAADAPGSAIADLPALAAVERHRIVTGFNAPKGRWTSTGISEQLRISSDTNSGGVSGAARSLSSAEIDSCADRVARRLAGQHHVRPGARIALRMSRDAYLVPVIVGIWRAGAALVPLDAVVPPGRASFIVQDSKACLLIVDSQESAAGIGDIDLAFVGELVKPEEAAASPPGRPGHPEPGQPAYLMYTSGSTGDPKGVVVPHRCLAALISAMTDGLRIGPTDVLVAVTSIAFDISMLELFAPLLAGGRVVLASQEVSRDPRAVAELLDATRATVMQATPTFWRAIMETGWRAGQRLRALSGGEPLDPALAGLLLSSCAEVWNLYGPTETTVWSTAGRVRPGEPVTVGVPIAGTYCYILSIDDRPAPCGAVGELVIGGAGVSDGYWGRPELTAASFILDPVRPSAGTVYRTGDRAQYLPDGRIALRGRADDQLKIRGHRIELGEVEALLSAHPQLRGAAVLVDREAPEPRLVAFIVPRTAGALLSRAELAGYLSARLPSAAVPADFTTLAELPAHHQRQDRPARTGQTVPVTAT